MTRFILPLICFFSATSAASPCTGHGTSIFVETSAHRLFLCEKGAEIKSFRVSFGKGGLGKRTLGDNKTPLGTYAIGKPRPSEKFGIFIPIGYPSDEQKRLGFTGSDVGIHGPHWFFQTLGPLTTLLNWTQGCVAVESRTAISEVGAWVNAHPFVLIEIQ